MACSACNKRRAAAAVPVPAAFTTKEAEGWPVVEYTGKNRADVAYHAPSGRKYRFGNNDQSRRQFVYPSDLEFFLRYTKTFRQMQIAKAEPPALVAEAHPVTVETPPPVPVAPVAPGPAPIMTDAKLARRKRA